MSCRYLFCDHPPSFLEGFGARSNSTFQSKQLNRGKIVFEKWGRRESELGHEVVSVNNRQLVTAWDDSS